MPTDRGVVPESFRLLPELLAPLLADTRHSVWLIPTPEFRWAALESRGGLWQIAGRTSDPDRALANLLERDRLFTESRDQWQPCACRSSTSTRRWQQKASPRKSRRRSVCN
ncbi:hypothetical protein AB0J74_27155 [Asanoa sp. NPDC049573]|uniref:hypothetical protein n=1 Tax=Asanoa sp. NPDC049573 TaxID=3155396 RepID=UPI003428463D